MSPQSCQTGSRPRARSSGWSRTRAATVGSVFLGVRDGGAWLYDITIDEAARGRGYGRAAMLALEAEVRALGFAGSA